MGRATFRFYAELGDLLPPERRGAPFEHAFRGTPSVKDAIESLGVPHTEVDLVLADGEPVDFAWRLRDGARVSVYPVFESLDVGPVTRVRAEPLRRARFVLDVHLGRLARYLRLAGFDARCDPGADDAALARVAAAEGRTLLTRDRGLLKRREVTHGYFVRAADARRQLAEILRRFDLARAVAPLRRCPCCNEPLVAAAPESVVGRVPPRVAERHREFRRCPACDRTYWRGTHAERVEQLLAEAQAEAARG